ncbi:hypothetical protein ACS0TY_022550 [Phlomoides rotata]
MVMEVEEQDRKTSSFNTAFNALNILLGVSTLSTPYALMSGGWLSMTLLFVLAIATFYTGLLIQRCMDSDPNIRTYPDIGHNAFGRKGRLVISLVLNLELYLVATGFLILAGDNLHNMFPNFKLIAIGGRPTFILLVALLLMPTVWIDNMSTLSYLSATGIIALILIFGSLLWSGIFDGIGFHHRGQLIHARGLPSSLGLYALCFSGHAVFPTLYTSMKNRRHFSLVLRICFSVCVMTCGAIAIIGYLMFGSELQSEITLNLPRDKLGSKVATYTAIINSVSKYALVLKPIVDIIETRFQSLGGRRRRRCYSILVGSTTIVALTIPFYGSLMSLVGASTVVAISILFPCLCYLKISGTYRKLCFESLIIVFTVLMGLLVLVIGTYASLAQIIQHLLHHTTT